MKKNKITKEDIITTAFIEWGKNKFKTRSLSTISNKLKITKPALYRYFSSKEELIKNMYTNINKQIIELSQSFIIESNGKTPDNIIFLYFDKYFYYFSKNPGKFYFYINSFPSKDLFNNTNKIFLHQIQNIFEDIIKSKSTNTWLESNKAFLCIRFIYSIGVFLLIHKFHDNKKILKPITDQDYKQIKDCYLKLVFNGFAKKNLVEIDHEKIEKEIELISYKQQERNKIFEGIASVVAENGLWGASISKIANKIGISKSNLYFYFKNKKEMIANTIFKEIELQNDIIKQNIEKYSLFEEKLYAIIITTFKYFKRNKMLLYLFNFLHSQSMDSKDFSKYKQINSVISPVLEQGNTLNKIDTSVFNNFFCESYLNYQIIKEIYISDNLEQKIDISEMRSIYKLFLIGLFQN